MSTRPLPVGILVSGHGGNLQALIDAVEAGRLSIDIRLVISSTETAYALERCRRHGIPWMVVRAGDHPSREAYDAELVNRLRSAGVELVALAGYMRILTAAMTTAFPSRILNIHPALLPAFPGLHVHRQVLAHGVRFSGCTVHLVDSGVDTGPIVLQAVVPVQPGDTEDTLAARIACEEHRIYPQALQWFAEGRVGVTGRQVEIRDILPFTDGWINPPLDMQDIETV